MLCRSALKPRCPDTGSGEYIHSHARYEVHIPKEDGLNVVFGSETVHISRGEILIIAPAVPHACLPENDSRKGFTYSFKDPVVSGFLAPLHFDGNYVVFPDTWDAMNMIHKVEHAFQYADPGSDAQIGYLVSSLLLDFARALTNQKEPAAAVQPFCCKDCRRGSAPPPQRLQPPSWILFLRSNTIINFRRKSWPRCFPPANDSWRG